MKVARNDGKNVNKGSHDPQITTTPEAVRNRDSKTPH